MCFPPQKTTAATNKTLCHPERSEGPLSPQNQPGAGCPRSRRICETWDPPRLKQNRRHHRLREIETSRLKSENLKKPKPKNKQAANREGHEFTRAVKRHHTKRLQALEDSLSCLGRTRPRPYKLSFRPQGGICSPSPPSCTSKYDVPFKLDFGWSGAVLLLGRFFSAASLSVSPIPTRSELFSQPVGWQARTHYPILNFAKTAKFRMGHPPAEEE